MRALLRFPAAIKAVVAAAYRETEIIDRTSIERNAKGEEEPHSLDPNLWRIGEAEERPLVVVFEAKELVGKRRHGS